MKKHRKRLRILLILIAACILGVYPSVSAQAADGAGEIAFILTPDTSAAVYSFTGVDVGAASAGYSALNVSYPVELQMNYHGTALSPSNKPANWTVTASTGTGGTVNISIMIAMPAVNGLEANIEDFLNASTFTLKTTGAYPPAGSGVTVMISEQVVIQFADADGGMHVYEFIEFAQQPDKSTLTWLQAYNAARGRSFSGQRGHLATLASIDEQMFVYNAIAQNPGWLGGTRLRYTSGGNPMIDGATDISAAIGDYTSNRDIANAWYWADGPEAGTVFYNRPMRDDTSGPVPGRFNFFSNGWTYRTYPQYQSQIQNGNEPNGDGGECCLQFAWSNKASWNDLGNSSSIVRGYYVEYDFPEGFSSSSGVAAAEFPVPLTVSFQIGNSACTGAIADQTVWVGGIATQPSVLRAGYLYTNYGNRKFLGWFEDPSDSAPFPFSTPLTASNTRNNAKTLYGKWEQYHNVSFDINNTAWTVGILTQIVVSGGRPLAPLGLAAGTVYSALSGQKFEFLGWFRTGQDPPGDAPFDFAADTVTADIALHAGWKPHHRVIFHVDNAAYAGAPPIDPQSVPDGGTASEPGGLIEGTLYAPFGNKKFLGWYQGAMKFDFSAPITAGITLTARWEQYADVTFANTRGHVVPRQTVTAGGTAAEPDTSSWDDPGFTFYGWGANGEEGYGNFTHFDFSAPINADAVAYGKWDPVVYSLTFDPNGGGWGGDTTPLTHEYFPGAYPTWEEYDPSHIPAAPSRPGYRFHGWLDGNKALPPDGPAVIGANNIYYAQWEPETYCVDYVLHGGTLDAGNPRAYTVEDEAFPIRISDPKWAGYSFLGWMAEYGNPSLPPATSPIVGFFIMQGVTGDIRLNARWNGGNEYIIYYDLGGGAGAPENPLFYTVEKTFALIAPVKHGYAFLGWTEAGRPAAPELYFSIPLGTMGDLYLTAHWSDPIVYDITYELDGGAAGAGNPYRYTVNDAFDLAAPVKQGYVFVGWTVAGALNRAVPALNCNIAEGTAGDLFFTAHWQKGSGGEGSNPPPVDPPPLDPLDPLPVDPPPAELSPAGPPPGDSPPGDHPAVGSPPGDHPAVGSPPAGYPALDPPGREDPGEPPVPHPGGAVKPGNLPQTGDAGYPAGKFFLWGVALPSIGIIFRRKYKPK